MALQGGSQNFPSVQWAVQWAVQQAPQNDFAISSATMLVPPTLKFVALRGVRVIATGGEIYSCELVTLMACNTCSML
eukprot:1159167-Pelagomonas_calceolata.AAC.8